MTGQVQIPEIQQAVLMWKEKGNEVIKRLNTPWEVTLPDDLLGVADVKYAENKITIDLSQMTVIQFKVCDADGNQKTANCLGWFSEDV